MPTAKNKQKLLTARSANKYVLYEASVQDTACDIHFINRVFKKERKRAPITLREDFCGTAKLCADWVASLPQRTAVGLDLHQPTLDWSYQRHVVPLGDKHDHVALLCRNVLDGTEQHVDVAVAFNFSYCIFKTRDILLQYARRVFGDLNQDGAFILDIHGGSECHDPLEERSKRKGFTYVWEQAPFDAVNGFGVRYIHFNFPDGTSMKRAFTYDWRLWTLPELRDILQEAGFARVDVYWEGADNKGGGNGIFRKVQSAVNEASWIAYVVAWKKA